MKNYLHLLMLVAFLASCKSKQSKSYDANIPAELAEMYPTLKLPYNVVDSTMDNDVNDLSISLKTFTTYIPDTIFNKPFGKNRNFKLFPIGMIAQKGKEAYFATMARGKNESAIYLSVYDSSRHIVTMPLLINDNDTGKVVKSASIDKKLTIAVNKEWSVKNELYYNHIIYAYNNVGVFTTVLTETNEQRRTETNVANPLDTFPRRYKYSGDYGKGTRSLLFIRDGIAPNEYLFFVHFQTDNKDEPCGGELRGKFKMIDPSTGQYTMNGDPCTMNFIFKENEVQVKENGSCGNYRDIKCFFNYTYIKKLQTKAPLPKKQH